MGEGVSVGRSRDDTLRGMEDFLRRNPEDYVAEEEPGFFRQIGQETTSYWGDLWRRLFGSGRDIRPEEGTFSGEEGARFYQPRGAEEGYSYPGGTAREENVRLIDEIMRDTQ